jgi:hypothetical protein
MMALDSPSLFGQQFHDALLTLEGYTIHKIRLFIKPQARLRVNYRAALSTRAGFP